MKVNIHRHELMCYKQQVDLLENLELIGVYQANGVGLLWSLSRL